MSHKRCCHCQGGFGLWRHNRFSRQFCSTWCVAHHENGLRDKARALETRLREKEDPPSTLFSYLRHPP